MTYLMMVEGMDEEERKSFDAVMSGETPPVLAAVPAQAPVPPQEQESNVEGLLAAFAMPQAPRGDNR